MYLTDSDVLEVMETCWIPRRLSHKILGELKIPGYSDYLHPYDENHIIGIGKDTVEALDSQKESRNLDFAWYQGIKIALFDVSDFENPK